jgi:basic membrane lipoprotein Med (substrate-binding protein (PBP1-ABC) superfamily)
VTFIQLDAAGDLGAPLQPENLVRVNFDTDVAYFQAGYLAAEKSTTKVVGVIGASNSTAAKRAIWFFRQGVSYYATESGTKVQIVGAGSPLVKSWRLIASDASPQWVKDNVAMLTTLNADVIFPAGLNGLAAAQEAAKTPGATVIGSDSDWYLQPRYESVKSVILASVQKLIGEQVLRAVLSRAPGYVSTPSPVPSGSPTVEYGGAVVPASQLVSGGVAITESHDVSYPNATDSTLAQLARSIEDGTIVLDPFN